ncbi:MAG: S1 family peptidase [Chloroflexota bacterium]
MRRSSGFRGAWRGMLGVLAVLLAVGALPLWSAAAPPQREIVGGSPVKAGTMPFMAAFLWLPAGEEYPWCAATLVTPDTVLTAASCLYYLGYVGEDLVLAEIAPEDLAVVVQGRGNTPLAELKRIAVTSIEYSPGFDVSSCGLSLMALSNIFACADDAALLRLAAPVRGAAPVTLIEPGSDGYWQKGQRLTAAGWSGEFLAQPPPGPLTRAALPVFDREVCGRRYER